jgi:hypothetical protein
MNNKAEVMARAKDFGGYVTRMSYNNETWDAPTFRACSEMVCDYGEKG